MSVKDESWLGLARRRELGSLDGHDFQERLTVTSSFIDRLGLEGELQGHEGCVNCLEWNERGTILASGSDDCHVMFWDPFRKKRLLDFHAGHHGNIFSVKFLPKSGDRTIATCAADCRVNIHDLEKETTLVSCMCHFARVKRLAVAPDTPYLLWSAAEDGYVLQYDLREPHKCRETELDGENEEGSSFRFAHRADPHRVRWPTPSSVLLNMSDWLGRGAEAKCINVSPTRPEYLVVGANDPFVRLYDRRMLSPGDDSSRASVRPLPPGCVRYYCPGHLDAGTSSRPWRNVNATYATFSQDGEELLVNLGGEQIYLFPVEPANAGPKAKVLDMNLLRQAANGKSDKAVEEPLAPQVEKLKDQANRYFQGEKAYEAIPLYNKAVRLSPASSTLYGNRAAAFMKRKWDGDTYAALRDCYTAIRLNSGHFKAHFRLARCLFELKLTKEAKKCLDMFEQKFPEQKSSQAYLALLKDLNAALKGEASASSTNSSSSTSSGSSTQSSATARRRRNLRSVRNRILVGPEEAADEADGDAHSAPEDSSNRSGEEGSASPASVHNVEEVDSDDDEDWFREPEGKRPAEGPLPPEEVQWRSQAVDYILRFVGHCNTTTDIKEANFFGQKGEQFIVAGSDEGSIFIWERETTNIRKILKGDDAIVNCLQPHPSCCFMATSGIDPVIRLWSPLPDDGKVNEREVEDVSGAAVANQKRMRTDPIELMIRGMSSGGDWDEDAVPPGVSLPLTCRPS